MRHRYALVFLVVALTTSGQEEPLPPVVPRATPLIIDSAPVVVLAVEPFHELHTPTLIEAARANDYRTFDALYREAKERGESLTQFATLHELWTYAVTNPIGAFYGRDLHDRLARSYPDYAKYIDDYRIIDNNGDAWWPTSETRMFLLDRAVEGRGTKVLIASDLPIPPVPVRNAAFQAAGPPASSRQRTAAAPKAQKTARVAAKAPVVKAAPVVAAPPVVAEPVIAAPTVVAETPAVVATPVVAEPAARTAARDAAAPAGVDASAPSTPTDAVTTAAPVVDAPRDSRGILLLVIGIIGVGMLALMLRTPAETVEAEKPKATVAPIRRAGGQATASPSSKSEPPAPRATGSHG